MASPVTSDQFITACRNHWDAPESEFTLRVGGDLGVVAEQIDVAGVPGRGLRLTLVQPGHKAIRLFFTSRNSPPQIS